MSRRAAREVAVRSLYQIEVGGTSQNEALAYNAIAMELGDREREFARDLVEGTVSQIKNIDALIADHAQNWAVERIARTDRSILRLAIYEIMFREDIPDSVAVNEAIELAKTYGDRDSGKFVNGILGNIIRTRPPQTGHSARSKP